MNIPYSFIERKFLLFSFEWANSVVPTVFVPPTFALKMAYRLQVICLIVIGITTIAALRTRILTSRFANREITLLREVPLELTGQLDESKSWDVKFVFQGVEKIVNVREDTSILESAEKIFKGVQSSCRNGVCTTCAGQVRHFLFVLVCCKRNNFFDRLSKVARILCLPFTGWGSPKSMQDSYVRVSAILRVLALSSS